MRKRPNPSTLFFKDYKAVENWYLIQIISSLLTDKPLVIQNKVVNLQSKHLYSTPTIMCVYNITLNDELLNETRRSFASKTAMDAWLQQQVEAMLMSYNASQQAIRQNARQAIAAMRKQSEENGNADMTLDEINSEIRQARQNRKASV